MIRSESWRERMIEAARGVYAMRRLRRLPTDWTKRNNKRLAQKQNPNQLAGLIRVLCKNLAKS